MTPEEIYEKHRVPELFTPWSKLLLERAAPVRDEHVLDLACGTGIVTRQLAPIVGLVGRVVGIDVSPGMLRVARSLQRPEGASIDWQENDAIDLPFDDGEFQLVTCQHSLQFFPDRSAAVGEVHRVLRKGGRFVASVWSGLDDHDLYKAMFESISRGTGEPVASLAHAWSFGTENDFRVLLEDSGFRNVSVTKHSLVARYPAPDEWLTQSVMGAGATIAAFRDMNDSEKTQLASAVAHDVADLYRSHIDDDVVAVPTTAYIGSGEV